LQLKFSRFTRAFARSSVVMSSSSQPNRKSVSPQFSKKQNLHVGQLAPVSREYRMKVLHGANEAVVPQQFRTPSISKKMTFIGYSSGGL
jgi:hypothetical protein